MDKQKVMYGLVAAIVLQICVLIMEFGNSVYPLVTGSEIKLKVVPVDPRSLFRGNYARLSYEISNVQLSDTSRLPRQNELVYVRLKQNEDGIYVEDGAGLTRPDEGIFIRGRAGWTQTGTTQVRYGIEAFFAPKEKALDLEKKLRTGGIAVIMLASNGKPALANVIAEH